MWGRPRAPDHGGMAISLHDERLGRTEARRQAVAVNDDLPDAIPITDEEVRVLDAWFGDLLDELFGLED